MDGEEEVGLDDGSSEEGVDAKGEDTEVEGEAEVEGDADMDAVSVSSRRLEFQERLVGKMVASRS